MNSFQMEWNCSNINVLYWLYVYVAWWHVTDELSYTIPDWVLGGIQRRKNISNPRPLSIPPTPPELQSIDFTFMKDSLVTTKPFLIWVFNSLFDFLCERTVILWIFWAREIWAVSKITVFFTGQIRADINKPERREETNNERY